MIFVTVGSQLPFDRLIKAMDAWCAASGRSDVFGQIAEPGPAGYYPEHFSWERFMSPQEFERNIGEAELIVAHAGMGSIIAALTMAKPIVIMPRRGALAETRNDHQYATWKEFGERPNIFPALDESELSITIDAALSTKPNSAGSNAHPFGSDELIDAVANYIHEGRTSPSRVPSLGRSNSFVRDTSN